MDTHQLTRQARTQVKLLADVLMQRSLQLACAESCTGGLLAKICTDLPGSSAWFDRAYITYSNAAKNQMLGVDDDLINQQGAVSEVVARAMVEGVVKFSGVTVAVSITGVAGPGGGSAEKPVGNVCFGFALPGRSVSTARMQFDGNRDQVRLQSVIYALQQLHGMLSETL